MLRTFLAMLLVLPQTTPRTARQLLIGQSSCFSFASRAETAELLGARDEFVASLSAFDRSGRLKSDRSVSEQEYLTFVRRQALDWTEEDISRITTAAASASRKLAALSAVLPTRILLAKTSGLEEAQSPYTRGNAVFLPAAVLAKPSEEVEDILLHEVFHIVSRRNPTLRKSLYDAVGFEITDGIELPAEYRRRKITNPDAPIFDSVVELSFGGGRIRVAPVLYSEKESYDSAKGGEFFDYLRFRLMAVEKKESRWVPALVGGKPQLFEVEQLPSLFDRIGRNTKYVIHPEEILADNFVLLARDKKDVPTPEILSRMRAVFERVSLIRFQE